MTGHQRRSVLGMLAAAPVGMLAATGNAEAARIPVGSYDRFIAQLAEQGGFSGTVLLSHRGGTVLSRAYGMADKEQSVPNRPDTIFALASASKPFTALAILQLA